MNFIKIAQICNKTKIKLNLKSIIKNENRDRWVGGILPLPGSLQRTVRVHELPQIDLRHEGLINAFIDYYCHP